MPCIAKSGIANESDTPPVLGRESWRRFPHPPLFDDGPQDNELGRLVASYNLLVLRLKG